MKVPEKSKQSYNMAIEVTIKIFIERKLCIYGITTFNEFNKIIEVFLND